MKSSLRPSARVGALLYLAFLAGTGAAQTTESRSMGAQNPPGQGLSGAAAPQGSLLAGGSDDCSTPEPIGGASAVVFFDSSMATTGLQGQANARCESKGSRAIEHDLWFVWTPPFDGTATLYTCSTQPPYLDTRLAVYEGAGCPAAEPLECSDDDGCGLSHANGSWVSFQARSGVAYLIQVGASPGAATGPGTLTVSLSPVLQDVYAYDAPFGGPDFALAPPASGEIGWIHRFDALGGADTLDAVLVAYGSWTSTAPPLVNGTPATVAVWSDPDQDGDPADAQLLVAVPTTVQNAQTGIKYRVDLPAPVVVQGKFFVGAVTSSVGGQEPAAATGSGVGGWSHAGRGWVVSNAGGSLDLSCLACNSTPPVRLPALGVLEGQFKLSARSGGSGLAYCSGDGSASACPCGNAGVAGAGCAHSGGSGALLWSSGTTRVSADDLVLTAVQLPLSGGFGLVYMGTQKVGGGLGVPFMDGLRCVGGATLRFPAGLFGALGGYLKQDSVVAGSGNAIQPGSTWHFQAWFRDPVGPCGKGANLSNALSVSFTP